MKVGEIYSLRMALVNAGYIPVPCRDRKPVIILRSAPSEGFVRSWATVHPEADQTGIVVGDQVIIVGSLEEARTAAAAILLDRAGHSSKRQNKPQGQPWPARQRLPGRIPSWRFKALQNRHRGSQGRRYQLNHVEAGQAPARCDRRTPEE